MLRNVDTISHHLGAFVGVPFGSLAAELGVAGLDRPATQRKSFAGDIAEAMLEVAKNSLPDPDLESIGAEIKTIPLDARSRPRENTKITALTPRLVASEGDFYTSHLYAKMRAILFLPIQKSDNDDPGSWYLRPPFLWLPSTDQLRVIRGEYDAYLEAIRAGRWEALSLRSGIYLGVNTSGERSAGMERQDKPYAWWLKKELTRIIVEENLSPPT